MPLSRGKPPRHHNGWVRKTLPYLGAWFIAGLLAVALASVGVSMVTEQVTTNNRPAALGAAEVRDEPGTEVGQRLAHPPIVVPGGFAAAQRHSNAGLRRRVAAPRTEHSA